MARYRDLDKIDPFRCGFHVSVMRAKFLEWLPEEDVAPVVHAHWTYEIDDLFPADSMMICSNCGEYERLGVNDNYCGNCGAKMDEVVE